ncbi:MAG: hypothetical protein ABSF62_17650 [Bryobacteraceae bacterium]
MRAIPVLVTAALGIIGVEVVLHNPMQRGDPQFDPRVAKPAYPTTHPRVYFDESHWKENLYQPFLDLIRNDGYSVSRHGGHLTRESLEGTDVLVLPIVMGFQEGGKTLPGLRHHLKGDAFTPEECAAVKNWVDSGGSLLLAADYAPTARSANTLARQFGVTLLDGWAVEPYDHDPVTGRQGFIIFSRENGQLLEHAITLGVNRVISFTGQAMLFPPAATPFLKLSPDALVAPYCEGRPQMKPAPAPGAAQGVALESGRGKAVILGESTILTAVEVRANNSAQHYGMSHANCDDRQLTLNIMHWLSRR